MLIMVVKYYDLSFLRVSLSSCFVIIQLRRAKLQKSRFTKAAAQGCLLFISATSRVEIASATSKECNPDAALLLISNLHVAESISQYPGIRFPEFAYFCARRVFTAVFSYLITAKGKWIIILMK